MGFLVFIGLVYVAIKIVSEDRGMGDFYRNMGDMYRKNGNEEAAKYQYKKAGDSDAAVGCSVIFLAVVGIGILMALLGCGS